MRNYKKGNKKNKTQFLDLTQPLLNNGKKIFQEFNKTWGEIEGLLEQMAAGSSSTEWPWLCTLELVVTSGTEIENRP